MIALFELLIILQFVYHRFVYSAHHAQCFQAPIKLKIMLALIGGSLPVWHSLGTGAFRWHSRNIKNFTVVII